MDIPIIMPFSLNTLARKRLSRKEENVSRHVVNGINMYSGVSMRTIINAVTHKRKPNVAIQVEIKLIALNANFCQGCAVSKKLCNKKTPPMNSKSYS